MCAGYRRTSLASAVGGAFSGFDIALMGTHKPHGPLQKERKKERKKEKTALLRSLVPGLKEMQGRKKERGGDKAEEQMDRRVI